jgi:hypothetical protein
VNATARISEDRMYVVLWGGIAEWEKGMLLDRRSRNRNYVVL